MGMADVYQALRMAIGDRPGNRPRATTRTGPLHRSARSRAGSRFHQRIAGIERPRRPGRHGRIGRASWQLRPAGGPLAAPESECSNIPPVARQRCRTARMPPPTGSKTISTDNHHGPAPDRPAARPRAGKDQPLGSRQPRPKPRRDRSPSLMAGQPGREWAGRDLADPAAAQPRNMLPSRRMGPPGVSHHSSPHPAKTARPVRAPPPRASATADAGP